MENVSIIIPNWNGKHLLVDCLESLKNQTYCNFQIIIVDNGSEDDSLSFLEKNYPEVDVIEFEFNAGLSVAVNAGINASTSEYVVVLNNDTEVCESWLAELVNAMDDDATYAYATSKILNFNNHSMIDSVGVGYNRFGLAIKIGLNEKDCGQYDQSVDVFSVCMTASIYRRSMLEDIGYFDEDFFAYKEDIDLGVRARLAGYRCCLIPSAKAYHLGSQANAECLSNFRLRLETKNSFNTLIKNMPLRMLVVILPLSIGLQVYRVMECLVTTRNLELRRNLKGYFLGLGAALKECPLMWKKRKLIATRRKISVKQFIYLIYQSELLIKQSNRRVQQAKLEADELETSKNI